MGNLRYKILRDLWGYRGRTILVMLIIGVGSAAIGMILGTRNLVIPGMQDIWQRMNPAMVNLFISPGITENELLTIGNIDGIEEIEAFNAVTVEWRVRPEDEWKVGTVTARLDYRDQNMNKLELIEGDWPHDRIVATGQDALVYGIPDGSPIELRVHNRIYKVPTEGKIYDQLTTPAQFGGTAQFYVHQDYYAYMVGDTDFSRALVKADHWDEDYVTELADLASDRLKKMGHETGRWITSPEKHFFQDQMDGIFMLLGVLGMLSLVLGLLVVYSTINSIIASQTDQIGVMKAIGARTRQIIWFYLNLVAIYGLLSLAISLPLGIFGAYAMTQWLVGSFGADMGGFQIDRTAVIAQSVLALIVPLLASVMPILMAARVTVREAISTYGLATRPSLLDRTLNRIRLISRVMIVTVSNTFRHRGRVILLELSLILSALVFMMVVSVQDSVNYTVRDVLFKILDNNVTLLFEDPVRIDFVELLTMEMPGVKAVEMWGLTGATIRPQGADYTKDDESIQVMGVPLPTGLYGYQLRSGRWLDPHDSAAIVLSTKLAGDIGVKVGDWVTVRYEEKKERNLQVVGLVFDPILTTFTLVNRDMLLKDIGSVGRAQSVWIQTEESGVAYEEAFSKSLRAFYLDNNIDVSAQRGVFGLGSDSTAATANLFVSQFNFLVVLLAVMAVVIGAVGSFALSGALSLSVLERRREIGVMRAIGASSWTIFRLFIGEGLILGWLSWLVALPLIVPAGRLMAQTLGSAFQFEMLYKYQPTGQILWFVIITILSVIFCFLPALGATRVSVRESLAYQ